MKIGIIGAGKMATAMALGLTHKKLVGPRDIMASARSAKSRERFLSHFPAGFVRWTTDNAEVIRCSDVIILGIEPQGMIEALKPLNAASAHKLFLSIASRIPLTALEKTLHPTSRVVRCMPNTPMQIGAGASVYATGKKATAQDEADIKKILEAGGAAWKLEEKLINAASTLSGSGPAYVYHFIAALAEGAVDLGLAPDLALALAVKTVEGSARMVASTQLDPYTLANQVKTPGGTTIAAFKVLEKEDMHGAVKRAMRAALKRTEELGA
jgi:pyrroline-5-carboxylate reductase